MKTNFEKIKSGINLLFTIIFIIFIIYLMIGNRSRNKKETVKKIDTPYKLLDTDNYRFTINMDYEEEKYFMEGYRYKDRISLIIKNKDIREEYIIFDDFALKKEGAKYTTDSIPFVLFNYYEVDNIKKILKKASKKDEQLVIKNANLLRNEEAEGTYEAMGENYINVIYTNKYITGFELDLSSYAKSFKDVNNFKLDIKYSEFNKMSPILIK